MTDPGLDRRLRQRSRRSGLMIGISMALTIAVCVGGFSILYTALDAFVGDFVSAEATSAPGPTQAPVQAAAGEAVPTTVADVSQPTQAAAVQPTAPPTVPPTAPAAEAPIATPPTFAPDYQSGGYSLNLRSEPSAAGGDQTVVTVLPPSTPLQYLNEEQATTNAAQNGDRWMRFRTEAGEEGWLREIDTEPYQP